MCLNHPALVHKYPTHLASSVMVRIVLVRVGSMCLNHPEVVHKHPTHFAISVVVCFL